MRDLTFMEKFFQSHAYMLSHLNAPVQRSLMDRIDWSHRMIGIRGPRGVGKTTFLLQYAPDHFDPQLQQCLYISMNNLNIPNTLSPPTLPTSWQPPDVLTRSI